MSSTLLIHCPPIFCDDEHRRIDLLIAKNEHLQFFRDRVYVNDRRHILELYPQVMRIRKRASLGSYLLYALLHLLARGVPSHSFRRYAAPLIYRADRLRGRYHMRLVDRSDAGIFVASKTGKLQFDMCQNARRMLRQGKPVWVATPGGADKWGLVPLRRVKRSDRMNRKEVISRLGEYATQPRSPLIEGINWLLKKH